MLPMAVANSRPARKCEALSPQPPNNGHPSAAPFEKVSGYVNAATSFATKIAILLANTCSEDKDMGTKVSKVPLTHVSLY